MHVLGNIGHGFSQRRKTHKPKDLHIRKVSFSGSSLSSGCSLSSSSSTSSASTARAPSSARTPTSASSSPGFGPLSAHPTFQPPPRLHDRPLISPERCRYQPASTFFDDSTDEDEDEDEDDYNHYCYDLARHSIMSHDNGNGGDYAVVGKAQALHFSHPTEMLLSHSSPSSTPSLSTDQCSSPAASSSDVQDYFTLQLARRPAMAPRSRWSDSTIQTLDLDLDLDLDQDEDQGQDVSLSSADKLDKTPGCEARVSLEDIPNFSHKRNVSAVPKRPPMRSLDSLEDLIKRSGWKRRGVVFNGIEAGADL